MVAIQVIPKTVPLVQRLVINRRNDPLTGGRGIGGDVEASDEDEDEDEKEEEEEAVEKRLARSEGDREAGKPTIRWGDAKIMILRPRDN